MAITGLSQPGYTPDNAPIDPTGTGRLLDAGDVPVIDSNYTTLPSDQIPHAGEDAILEAKEVTTRYTENYIRRNKLAAEVDRLDQILDVGVMNAHRLLEDPDNEGFPVDVHEDLVNVVERKAPPQDSLDNRGNL